MSGVPHPLVAAVLPVVEAVGATLVSADLPDPGRAAEWSERGLTGLFADIGRLPFTDDTFDLVLVIEVLEHVPDPDLALRQIARVCRGTVVASVPARATTSRSRPAPSSDAT